jgi:hypothetical protein
MLTDVVCAGLARRTVPALVDRFDGDPVAFFPIGHSLTDIGDDAGELVPDHQGHLLMCQRVRFRRDENRSGVVLVKVGAADSVEADLELDRSRSRCGFGDIGDLDLVRPVVHSCFHAASCM